MAEHFAPGILAIFNNVASAREAEFEEWFQHEHLAERIAVPDFPIGDGTKRYQASRATSMFMSRNRRRFSNPPLIRAARRADTDDAYGHVGNLQGHDPDGVSSHLSAWCHAGYGRGNRTVWRTPG